jgi:hypothetical protein
MANIPPKRLYLTKHYFMPLLRHSIFLVLFYWIHTLSAQAQSYNNEWIDHSQTYYKIKVGKDALYRIPYSTLQNAGLPAQANEYHLYRNGAEVPIYISSNTFTNANDYIEFYGKRNDGSLDTPLYAEPMQQASPYKSLFSDTAAYFLVWKPSVVELLFSPVGNDISNAPAPLPYFMHQQRTVTANAYADGRPITVDGLNNYLPFFGEGEGWLSLPIQAPDSMNYNVNTPAVYTAPDAPKAQWELKIAGRNNNFGSVIDHHLQIKVNGAIKADNFFADYNCYVQQFDMAADSLSMPQTQLTIKPVGDLAANDAVSIAYFQVTYPRLFNFGNQRLFEFQLPHNDAAYIEISNFNGETAPVLYDLTNLKRVIPIINSSGLYQISLNAGSNIDQPRRLVLCNTTHVSSLITVTQLSPRTFTDYSQAAQQGNYLIVASPQLGVGDTNTVAEYANYRRSAKGGGHLVSVAYIDELYDQFAFGTEKNPLAIVNFVNYAVDVFDSIPTQLLLLGKATMHSRFSLLEAYQQCLVPTFGVQPSDLLLAARNRNNPLPQLAVGRVPAQNANELAAYLNKVKDYESEFHDFYCADTSVWWRRKTIALATENDISDYNNALNTVRSYADSLSVGYFAADTLGVYGQLAEDDIALPQFDAAMNSGVGIIFFAGEQQNNRWRLQINSPNAYNNQDRYPFIISQSDFIGNIHGQQPTMANEFVLADQRGAIGFMDNVVRAVPGINKAHINRLLNGIRSNDYGNSIGIAQKNAVSELLGDNPSSDLFALTYTLCGDPALSIVPAPKPELMVQESDLMFYTTTGIPIFGNPAHITSSMSHFEARFSLWNLGKNSGDSCQLRVKRWLSASEIVDVLSQKIAVPRTKSDIALLIPNSLPNNGTINTFFFSVDYNGQIDEMCENNNTISKAAEVDNYVNVATILAAEQYRVYPIPAHEQLFIETQQPATLTICDLQGKTLWQQNNSIGKQTCPTTDMADGLYLLRISTAEGTATVKIVVK